MILPASDSDPNLIQRLRQRDPHALAVCYDRYSQPVYSLIIRITGDQKTAEDLTHDLFLRLWNDASSLHPHTQTLECWLLSAARTIAIRHLRPDHFTDSVVWETPRTNKQHTLDLKTAWAALLPLERQILELAYFQGCSQLEIAARLQQPLEEVKVVMRSALNHLQPDINHVQPEKIISH